ncbi:hypothetical protein, partial [Salmonella enterica]|uniref:hypothetical protein n=1 Tax=Salmonella enterica TaxID=28901 RepID=UPI001C0EB92C
PLPRGPSAGHKNTLPPPPNYQHCPSPPPRPNHTFTAITPIAAAIFSIITTLPTSSSITTGSTFCTV